MFPETWNLRKSLCVEECWSDLQFSCIMYHTLLSTKFSLCRFVIYDIVICIIMYFLVYTWFSNRYAFVTSVIFWNDVFLFNTLVWYYQTVFSFSTCVGCSKKLCFSQCHMSQNHPWNTAFQVTAIEISYNAPSRHLTCCTLFLILHGTTPCQGT